MKKSVGYIFGIIALSFLWTGSAYISVAYRLMESYSALDIDIYLVFIGYLLQALGMLLFSLLVKRKSDIKIQQRYFSTVLICEAIVITIILLCTSNILAFALSFIMNLLHGMVAGFYLTLLSSHVPQQYRGRVFGFGYAFGSIANWLISLPYDGKFLGMDGIIVVYIALIAATFFITSRVSNADPVEEGLFSSKGITVNYNFLINTFLVLVLLSLVKNLGFYFPSSDINGIIDLELSRAFYAIGLIVAGLINDNNRRYGAICSVAALSFAFISFALKNNPEYSAVIWIIGYIFFGFFAVYRVVVFSDLASDKKSLVYLAPYGLMAGRIGDSLGTISGVLLSEKIGTLVLITTGLFVVLIFLFFTLYDKLYNTTMTQNEKMEYQFETFEKKYNLTRRESEVFRLIVQAKTNIEISSALFVSESTVKYHVGNILKKVECTNRTELTMKFRSEGRFS